jgi:hypothetical protein
MANLLGLKHPSQQPLQQLPQFLDRILLNLADGLLADAQLFGDFRLRVAILIQSLQHLSLPFAQSF